MKIIVTILNEIVDFFKVSQDIFKISTILSYTSDAALVSVDKEKMKEFIDLLINYNPEIKKIFDNLNIIDNNYPDEICIKNLIPNNANSVGDKEDCVDEIISNIEDDCVEEITSNEDQKFLEILEEDKEINYEEGYKENTDKSDLWFRSNSVFILFNDKLKTYISKIFKETINTSKRLEDLENKKKRLITELIMLEQSIHDCFVCINNNKFIDKFVNDIDKLKINDNIEEIGFTKDEIVIITKELITQEKVFDYKEENDGELFFKKIGRMRIGVNILLFFGELGTVTNFITIHNMSRGFYDSYSGRILECGHVFRNETMCLGDVVTESLIKAFALKNISMIFDIIIRFITQPNMNDELGVFIKFFPNVI